MGMTKELCSLRHYQEHVNIEAHGGRSTIQVRVVFILFFGLFLSLPRKVRQLGKVSVRKHFCNGRMFEGLDRKWELYSYVACCTIEDVAKSQSISSTSSISCIDLCHEKVGSSGCITSVCLV